MQNYNCIVVLGPTASGKTRLACQLAYQLNGEIISADSRQVYKHLNIGTGKDLEEYEVNGTHITYHLINVIEPDEQFYLHQFIAALKNSFDKIRNVNKIPIICGGTGLYLDTLHKDFSLTQIKEDEVLRKKLAPLSKDELIAILKKFPVDIIKQVDLDSKKRIIRGIEIAEHFSKNKTLPQKSELPYKPFYIGLEVSLEERKKLISDRLHKRLEGLIKETGALIENGISYERLALFGLEYKFTALYLQQKITKEEFFFQLETAIFQFAKRQMTWFRKMEKEGVNINWMSPAENFQSLIEDFKNNLVNK